MKVAQISTETSGLLRKVCLAKNLSETDALFYSLKWLHSQKKKRVNWNTHGGKKKLPLEKREEIKAKVREGLDTKNVAFQCNVSVSSVQRIKHAMKESGEI